MDQALADLELSYEIIVVDDGSSDATAKRARELQLQVAALSLIQYPRNRGKGFAVKTGVAEARGRVVLFADADNATPPSEAAALLACIDEGADAAIGSRWVPGANVARRQPWYRVGWGRLANWIVQRTLVAGIRDTQCGFKAFRAEAAHGVFERLSVYRWSFDLKVLVLLDRLGYTVREVPVTWADDRRSHVRPVRDLLLNSYDFTRVLWNLRSGRYDSGAPNTTPTHAAKRS